MIKIAICDDNNEELELSRKIISEIMDDYKIPCEIVGFCAGEMLLHTDLDFHLIFLDIIMDEKNHIKVFNRIIEGTARPKLYFRQALKNIAKMPLMRPMHLLFWKSH